MKNFLRIVLAAACISAFAVVPGCGNSVTDFSCRETMYQISTLQSLMAGNYDGFVTVGELRRSGDIGLGTFSRIDGEMIVLDGIVYQARYDGSVQTADDSLGVPFATVTSFDKDIECEIGEVKSLEDLAIKLDAAVDATGKNLIYVARIDAKECPCVTVRSELPQEKPYRPLVQALADSQREFTYHNVSGTVVAVYFPAFFNMQNTPGWHCHFISDDRSAGGHMTGFECAGALNVQLDITPYYNLYLPCDDAFSRSDLSRDMASDIEKVEK